MESLKMAARRVGEALLAEHPDWEKYFEASDGGNLGVAVPAPNGSNAGYLITFTTKENDIWIRFAPPRMCYPVESEDELIGVVRRLLADQLVFVVIMSGDEWVETTLAPPGEEKKLKHGQVARIVSWTGIHDTTLEN
jgi:hypothetical protein